MSEITTSEAIEVLRQKKKYLMKKQLKRATHKRASLSPVVPDIIQALDKAIEVMGNRDVIENAIQDGLHATCKFTSVQCDQLAEGLMIYIKEALNEL